MSTPVVNTTLTTLTPTAQAETTQATVSKIACDALKSMAIAFGIFGLAITGLVVVGVCLKASPILLVAFAIFAIISGVNLLLRASGPSCEIAREANWKWAPPISTPSNPHVKSHT